jgi:ubiquinone/menaquinone biosynthesis C-methylase UbiE
MSESAEGQKSQTQATFNQLASDYDLRGPGTFAYFGRRLVETVGVEPGHHVLDVATGRGAVLFPAAQRAGATGRVVGIDFAEAMVQATADQAKLDGVAVALLQMDAEHLDFPDTTFDRVLCGFGVMFFPQLGQALGEFRRVLKPGGRLGVSTWQVAQSEDVSDVLVELGLRPGRPPGWLTDPDRLEHLLRDASFRDSSVAVEAYDARYVDLDEYWHGERASGPRSTGWTPPNGSSFVRHWQTGFDRASGQMEFTSRRGRCSQPLRVERIAWSERIPGMASPPPHSIT